MLQLSYSVRLMFYILAVHTLNILFVFWFLFVLVNYEQLVKLISSLKKQKQLGEVERTKRMYMYQIFSGYVSNGWNPTSKFWWSKYCHQNPNRTTTLVWIEILSFIQFTSNILQANRKWSQRGLSTKWDFFPLSFPWELVSKHHWTLVL